MFSLIQLPNLRWIPEAFKLSFGASATHTTRYNIQREAESPPLDDVRSLITDLLSQCDIAFYRAPYNQSLHDLCIQECKLKGYPIDAAHGKFSIFKYIPSGVTMASTSYAHHKSQATLVFIAIYTAYLSWMDDTYVGGVRGVDSFNERFINGKKQADEGLDGFARVLQEVNLHWPGVQGNVIVTASLNFTTSLTLEFETQGMAASFPAIIVGWNSGFTVTQQISPHAKSYAEFQRVLTGAAEPFAMFIFPTGVPMSSYIQVIPDLTLYINYMNDLLSFYKEEKAGENGNYISNEANRTGQRKIQVFKDLAQDISDCVSRIANILVEHQGARDASLEFVRGFVSFHISFDPRYHLNELFPTE